MNEDGPQHATDLNMRLSGSGPVGGVKFFPSAQELAHDGAASVHNAESGDVDGSVLLDLVVPAVIHHL